MKLIADSGSTKTDWRLITSSSSLEEIKTEGINPFHQRSEEILKIVTDSDLTKIAGRPKEIYFYGAGCNYEDKIAIVKNALGEVFTDAEIFVEHDLIAAARALCGRDEGIACILGTGSNSCYYDGQNILQNNPSLGYILGDEGSGAFIGKKLIVDFLYNKLPRSINEKFNHEFELSIDVILDNIYSRFMPNRFLGSFGKFIYDNIQHPYMHGLVYESFYAFLDNHVVKYEGHRTKKCHFVGSIAYNFKDILEKVCGDLGLKFGRVIESPIDGLILYHQNRI